MSKTRRTALERVAGFWRRFSAYVPGAEEGETPLPLVILLAAVIPELSSKQYDNIEDRLKRSLEKGGKLRT